jgi:hypothetical protein
VRRPTKVVRHELYGVTLDELKQCGQLLLRAPLRSQRAHIRLGFDVLIFDRRGDTWQLVQVERTK